MPNPAEFSPGALIACGCLSLLALLLWLGQMSLLDNLTGSDAAGDGMAQGFAAVIIILLWLLLSAMVLLAIVMGRVPPMAAIAAVLLIIASGIAAGTALGLLTRPDLAPYKWPIVTPAAVPALVMLFCYWALIPGLRAAIPAWAAAGGVWGAVLLLSLAMIPLMQLRHSVVARLHAEAAQVQTAFEAVPADAPLWDWVPYLRPEISPLIQDRAIERIDALGRRQADAELMLGRGDFPMGYLRRIDLDPTPSLCENARALLRKRVEPLVLKTPQSRDYAEIALPVAYAADDLEWLTGYGCNCNAEAEAWETMAGAYRGRSWDVVRLGQLREPDELGRVLRERPARFSMLTPAAHLKAWLKFTDDKTLRDQALAGARKLDHRTEDAVQMLGDEFGSGTVLTYLPELDLQATPEFCFAALAVIRGRIDQTYRPKPDDPRSYDELLSRLGGATLPALIWLAQHGCDADAELHEAAALIGTYRDSPDRAAMLVQLAALRRGP
jgi:hypothetical protein